MVLFIIRLVLVVGTHEGVVLLLGSVALLEVAMMRVVGMDAHSRLRDLDSLI